MSHTHRPINSYTLFTNIDRPTCIVGLYKNFRGGSCLNGSYDTEIGSYIYTRGRLMVYMAYVPYRTCMAYRPLLMNHNYMGYIAYPTLHIWPTWF